MSPHTDDAGHPERITAAAEAGSVRAAGRYDVATSDHRRSAADGEMTRRYGNENITSKPICTS